MTDLIRTALLGTDATGSSYHDFMRSVTVHSMRQAAGYVAPVMDTSNDLWQHTLGGSKVLIETDVKIYKKLWYEAMDTIVNLLTGDDLFGSILERENNIRIKSEAMLNRGGIRQVPHFWEYVFSQADIDCIYYGMALLDLPEYPINYAELEALYEKYGVKP